MTVTIVSRAQWGARAPKYRNTIHTPTPRLWIHHTASEQHGPAGVRAVQAYHMDTKDWSDIAYSFLVDDDGAIYEGRGAGIAGGHTKGDNTGSHAICAIGNLDARQPTDAQVQAIGELAGYGRDQGWWGAITGGHRDAPGAQTACPGRHLYARIPDLRRIAAAGDPDPQPEDPDMPIILFSPGVASYLVAGGNRLHLLQADAESLIAQGIRAFQVSAEQLDKVGRDTWHDIDDLVDLLKQIGEAVGAKVQS